MKKFVLFVAIMCTAFSTFADEVTLIDGNDYIEYWDVDDDEDVDITYIRQYADLNWEPFYVPFDVDYDVFTAAGLEVAKLTLFDGQTLYTELLKEGSYVPANSAVYMARAKQVGEVVIKIDHTTLYYDLQDWVELGGGCATLIGNYRKGTKENDNYYLLGGGKLGLQNGAFELQPYRWLFVDKMHCGAEEFEVLVDGVPTGIININGNSGEKNAPTYNLSGQRVDASHKGLIIRGGKKVIVM